MSAIGNAYGYTSHARHLKEACARAGVFNDPDSKIAVHIITPDKFQPIPNKKNILYTMYECTTLPSDWIDAIQYADLLIVPCKQNKELFANYYKGPIEVVWEGVDVFDFPYVERKMPLVQPFMFLWVGAPNPRKGFEYVGAAWDNWILRGDMPNNVLLYCKTSGVKAGEQVIPKPKSKTIIDTRNLDIPQLFELYKRANAFLLPSMGEGFGLTLAEAMSTGLPCVFTPWGGPRDFCSSGEGYPVKWKFRNVKTLKFTPTGDMVPYHESCAASADVSDVLKQMKRIYYGYEHALDKGKKAAARIRAGFTWEHSANSFIKVLEKYAS